MVDKYIFYYKMSLNHNFSMEVQCLFLESLYFLYTVYLGSLVDDDLKVLQER